MKYVLVSGGVASGIGKGIIASSVGLLLSTTGLSVTMIKIDPYMNIDAGTTSPTERGEIFVLEDGSEVDVDLGNYERFLDTTLTGDHHITAGKIHQKVIERERRGDYLGEAVKTMPHFVDAVVEWIERVAQQGLESRKVPDVCVIELGGIARDMENAPFLEALRRLRMRAAKHSFVHILVSLIPTIMNQENNLEPTHAAIRDVVQNGLKPDIIAVRCANELDDELYIDDQLARTYGLDESDILVVPNAESTYHVPACLKSQGVVERLYKLLNSDELAAAATIDITDTRMWDRWDEITMPKEKFTKEVTIAFVGKHVAFADAYESVKKALEDAALAHRCRLHLSLMTPNALAHEEPDGMQEFYDADGVLLPGGFGARGSAGMTTASSFAIDYDMPFLGIGMGMQLAVVDYATDLHFHRNRSRRTWVDSLQFADTTEIDPDTPAPVVDLIPHLEGDGVEKGGTLHRGLHRINLLGDDGSKIKKLYGQDVIKERHRQRYRVNPHYVELLVSKGLRVLGEDKDGMVEIIERKDQPFHVGVQFHPEFTSRVNKPHPVFMGFIEAALERVERKEKGLVKPHPLLTFMIEEAERHAKAQGKEKNPPTESPNS